MEWSQPFWSLTCREFNEAETRVTWWKTGNLILMTSNKEPSTSPACCWTCGCTFKDLAGCMQWCQQKPPHPLSLALVLPTLYLSSFFPQSQTHTQTDYNNPRCICTQARVNKHSKNFFGCYGSAWNYSRTSDIFRAFAALVGAKIVLFCLTVRTATTTQARTHAIKKAWFRVKRARRARV